MHELAKIFLMYLNQETFETPSARKSRNGDLQEYKMNYTRFVNTVYKVKSYQRSLQYKIKTTQITSYCVFKNLK